jgi:hypothetical protein
MSQDFWECVCPRAYVLSDLARSYEGGNCWSLRRHEGRGVCIPAARELSVCIQKLFPHFRWRLKIMQRVTAELCRRLFSGKAIFEII